MYQAQKISWYIPYITRIEFIDNCFSIIARQSLHGKELGFTHPETQEFIKFNSELPDDMAGVIEKWRNYSSGVANRVR